MAPVATFVGIDLGTRAIHAVVLGRSVDAVTLAADATDDLVALAEGARCIAIDAPAALSTSRHADDASLSPKFRTARCAEIALGRELRIWVPWVTPPTLDAAPSWMKIGFRVYEALVGHRLLEVYPHAAFHVLAGGRVPTKTSPAGVRARAALLRDAGVDVADGWSHDALDAAVAALIARRADAGTARAIGCGHDGSAIWLP